MTFRKLIFWMHLCTGVGAGLVILLMSVTGVLLAFELQIIHWANREYRQAPPTPESQQLPIAQMLAAISDEKSPPTGISFENDPAAPAAIALGRGRTIYVNPYNGSVHGEGSPRLRAFFRGVTDLHRWIALPGDQRTIGRAITGACNLAFLFLIVSGIYLWWPGKWNWATLKRITLIDLSLRKKARDWNWHNAIGLWCWLPLLLIVASGVVISYPWASALLYRAVGETPPTQGPSGGAQPGRARGQRAGTGEALAGVDEALRVARSHMAGWRSISVSLPRSAESPLVFSIDQGTGRQPQKKGQLTLSRNGEVVKWEPFSSQTPGRRLRAFARFGHTGEVAGIPGQTIAGLASAGSAVLVWTGFALTWRRWVAARRRKAIARDTGKANLPMADQDESKKLSEQDVAI